MTPREQLRALRELVLESDRLDDEGIDDEGRTHFPHSVAAAFRDMLGRLADGYYDELSPKQCAFLKTVYERVFSVDVAPVLMSGGTIPRGREVELPEVLKNLPMRPPSRRSP
jgi:hypothetical protein